MAEVDHRPRHKLISHALVPGASSRRASPGHPLRQVHEIPVLTCHKNFGHSTASSRLDDAEPSNATDPREHAKTSVTPLPIGRWIRLRAPGRQGCATAAAMLLAPPDGALLLSRTWILCRYPVKRLRFLTMSGRSLPPGSVYVRQPLDRWSS